MKSLWLTLVCSVIGLSACQEPVIADTAAKPAVKSTGEVHIPTAEEIAAKKERHFAEQLAALTTRNPEAEAQTALNNGERYLLCNAGRGAILPGLSAQQSTQARQVCAVQCLDGVTDAIYGENHRRYLTAALDFSARWNQVMVSACR